MQSWQSLLQQWSPAAYSDAGSAAASLPRGFGNNNYDDKDAGMAMVMDIDIDDDVETYIGNPFA
jgi:hypothetical protein